MHGGNGSVLEVRPTRGLVESFDTVKDYWKYLWNFMIMAIFFPGIKYNMK